MKKVLLYLILIIAVGMAGTVAYVSVNGLLKVFAGAGTVGLIFFCAIEAAKIIATSAIHTYGKKIGWFYNLILSLFIVIAMAITSMGIYGFLSSSYKETFSKLENMGAQIELLEKKRDGYQGQLDLINSEKESVTNTITELSKGLSNNVIQYRDKETGEIITTTSSATRRALEKQLDRAVERQEELNIKSDDLSGKVFDIENEILETKLGDDTSAELGPLRYLADVTGLTMDEVMKYFIILLIIIGDPMAVIMVIVFNKVVNRPDEEEPKKSWWSKVKDKFKKKDDHIEEEKGEDDYIKEVADKFKKPYNDYKIETWESDFTGEPLFSEEENDIEVEKQMVEVPKEFIEEIKPEPKPEAQQKIKVEEIKEIKEGKRDFSVNVPQPSNKINRVGSNKYVKNNDGKIIFKRGIK